MAGFFDTGPPYVAGFSLCEASDRMMARGPWQWPPVKVHVRSMQLILAAGCESTEATNMLPKGLASVVARLPKQAGNG